MFLVPLLLARDDSSFQERRLSLSLSLSSLCKDVGALLLASSLSLSLFARTSALSLSVASSLSLSVVALSLSLCKNVGALSLSASLVDLC